MSRHRLDGRNRAFGFMGDYDSVRRYAQRWFEDRSRGSRYGCLGRVRPAHLRPGETYQFDWSHEIALMDGVTTQINVAGVRLCPRTCSCCAPTQALLKTELAAPRGVRWDQR